LEKQRKESTNMRMSARSFTLPLFAFDQTLSPLCGLPLWTTHKLKWRT